ncbi:acetyltransferase [Vibrio splendidus]|nr:acetyltransferase [Vibrio splendidus 1S-124]PTQ14558.1 acetyltransferase [Vibrio splendidus]
MFKRYGIIGSSRLLLDLTLTKLLFRQCRIVRRPFYIRGREFIDFSEGFTSGVGLRIDCFKLDEKIPELYIGKHCQINDYVHIACTKKVSIGDGVLIASKVFISDHNHGNIKMNPQIELSPGDRDIYSADVVIGDDVWLGENAVILPGVTIGKSSIVGASSVITKSVPPYSIVVGNPGKVIKRYSKVKDKWESVK